ncbi:MAG: phenylalanine--tRNA ligase subunit alpha, partial [Roseibium sp.]
MSDLNTLETELLAAVESAASEAELEEIRVSALGKKGKISEQMKTLGKMSPEERQTMGPALNGLKARVTEAI